MGYNLELNRAEKSIEMRKERNIERRQKRKRKTKNPWTAEW